MEPVFDGSISEKTSPGRAGLVGPVQSCTSKPKRNLNM
jgi:hypothetical protein